MLLYYINIIIPQAVNETACSIINEW